jgi:hypothetical protein
MIWALLAIIGVPLWLIALAIVLLLRARVKVRSIPGSVRCKVRSTTPGVPGIRVRFPRTMCSVYWVHHVLIVHTGVFLTRSVPIGIAALESLPQPWEGTHRPGRFESPVTVRLRADSGVDVEAVCADSDAHALMGAFARSVSERP